MRHRDSSSTRHALGVVLLSLPALGNTGRRAAPDGAAACGASRTGAVATAAGIIGTSAVDWSSGYPLVELTRVSEHRLTRGWALIDLGASVSVVTRRFASDSAGWVPYAPSAKAGQARALVTGADGASVVLRRAWVSDLHAGSIDFGARDILVADTLPRLFGRPIEAIIGLDLLAPSGRARFDRDGDDGWLTLGDSVHARHAAEPPEAVVASLTKVGGLLAVNAIVDTSAALLILDSGSFGTFIDPAMAARVRLNDVREDDDAPFGLSERFVSTYTARVRTLSVGPRRWRHVAINVGRLEALRSVAGLRGDGLLGSDLLKSLRGFELDFRCETLKLWT